jgi:hypothetical protein
MPPVRTQAEFELQDQRKKVNTQTKRFVARHCWDMR